MHITLINEYDIYDPDVFSGTLYQISKELAQRENVQLHNMHIHPSQKLLPLWEEIALRCKQFWLRVSKGTHFDIEMYERRSKHIADMLSKPLANLKTDVILTAMGPFAAAHLNTKIPIVYWSDFVYGAVAGFYPDFRFHDPETNWHGHLITTACLMNAKLLIFSSQWAARTAVELYGISKNKIKVVPFGPNFDISHSRSDVEAMIQRRSRDCIKLLFVGKFWYRKGGDIVLRVAEQLHAAGYPVELTIVGCTPNEKSLPPYVKCMDFFSKNSKANLEKMKQLYADAHFFFMPSRAEAFGIVFCEANAFGVPCITTHVGGISDVIKDGVNGMTFSLEATIKEMCDYIANTFENYLQYEALANASYNEYATRLNWQSATTQVKKLIEEII